MENALVHNVNTRVDILQFLLLQLRQTPADFDNVVPRAFVNARVFVTNVVQDVKGQSPVTGTDLVNDEILIREVLEQVFRDKTFREGLPVVWLSIRCQTDTHKPEN